MRIYGVTGWKNAGKTTLTAALVREITGRGFTVSTLKHAHHGLEIDHEGRDSFRHREAGAQEVLVASPTRWALMAELRGASEPAFPELLARLSPADLVLVEGWKHEAHPKVEAWRPEIGRPPLAAENPTIRAVAATAPPPETGRPVLPLDDPAAVADFILRETGLA
jgi:molybdopterin-guanine dinucleotide biosynthesis protein MobB